MQNNTISFLCNDRSTTHAEDSDEKISYLPERNCIFLLKKGDLLHMKLFSPAKKLIS
jgi:hypothetical protein